MKTVSKKKESAPVIITELGRIELVKQIAQIRNVQLTALAPLIAAADQAIVAQRRMTFAQPKAVHTWQPLQTFLNFVAHSRNSSERKKAHIKEERLIQLEMSS